MTGTPPSVDAVGSIEALEEVLHWLRETAADFIDWRSYLQSDDPRGAFIVIWDGRERPFLCCGLSHQPPCPVYLALDGEIRTSRTQHDCGAELVPPRHVTKWLTDLRTLADVQDAVKSLLQAQPVVDSWSLRSS